MSLPGGPYLSSKMTKNTFKIDTFTLTSFISPCTFDHIAAAMNSYPDQICHFLKFYVQEVQATHP